MAILPYSSSGNDTAISIRIIDDANSRQVEHMLMTQRCLSDTPYTTVDTAQFLLVPG